MIGGGLDKNNLGLTTEIRDLKREMSDQVKYTMKIQTVMDEIKAQLIPSQQVLKDITEIKFKLEGYDRYKYITWGILLAAGWIITKVSPFIEKLIP